MGLQEVSDVNEIKNGDFIYVQQTLQTENSEVTQVDQQQNVPPKYQFRSLSQTFEDQKKNLMGTLNRRSRSANGIFDQILKKMGNKVEAAHSSPELKAVTPPAQESPPHTGSNTPKSEPSSPRKGLTKTLSSSFKNFDCEPKPRPTRSNSQKQTDGARPNFVRTTSGAGIQQTIRKMALKGIECCATPPKGVITFVFTDIQDSTSLWEHNEQEMFNSLEIHNEEIRRQITKFKGYEVKTEGDSFLIAFSRINSAVRFCLDVQKSLLGCNWPAALLSHPSACETKVGSQLLFRGLRVRMGIHCGTAISRLDPSSFRTDYFGRTVNRASRVAGIANGGCITISSAAKQALEKYKDEFKDLTMTDLGTFLLKGIEGEENVLQILPMELAQRAEQADLKEREREKEKQQENNSLKKTTGLNKIFHNVLSKRIK